MFPESAGGRKSRRAERASGRQIHIHGQISPNAIYLDSCYMATGIDIDVREVDLVITRGLDSQNGC